MHPMKKLAIAAFFSLGLCAAHAQFYGELGYTTVNTKTTLEGETYKSSPNALRGVVGYDINPNLSAELMLGLSLGSASVKSNGQALRDENFKINRMVGLYLKPKMELAPGLEAFGRVGFVDAKSKWNYGVGSDSSSVNGLSYGAGLSYALSKTVSLNLDYMHYGKKDNVTAKGITAGVGFKF